MVTYALLCGLFIRIHRLNDTLARARRWCSLRRRLASEGARHLMDRRRPRMMRSLTKARGGRRVSSFFHGPVISTHCVA